MNIRMNILQHLMSVHLKISYYTSIYIHTPQYILLYLNIYYYTKIYRIIPQYISVQLYISQNTSLYTNTPNFVSVYLIMEINIQMLYKYTMSRYTTVCLSRPHHDISIHLNVLYLNIHVLQHLMTMISQYTLMYCISTYTYSSTS